MGPRRRCRGRADCPGRRQGVCGFNGATTKVSWKGPAVFAWVRSDPGASMGPRRRCRGKTAALEGTGRSRELLQWGHDEGVVEGHRPRSHSRGACAGFNGATTKVSWKGFPGDAHGLLSVPASMGPRRRCRGRADAGQDFHSGRDRFNWAATKVSGKGAVTEYVDHVHKVL